MVGDDDLLYFKLLVSPEGITISLDGTNSYQDANIAELDAS